MMLEKKFMLTKSGVMKKKKKKKNWADRDETSYGFDFLLSKVQASEMELKDALENPSIFDQRGKGW